MKSLLVPGIVLSCSCFSHYHNPTINISTDFFELSKFSANAGHQSTFCLNTQDFILVSSQFLTNHLKSLENLSAVGYRRFYDDYGFGLNFAWAFSINTSLLNHQICPGFELFAPHFQLSYNSYTNLHQKIDKKEGSYLFSDTSELIFGYIPSKNYRFQLGFIYNVRERDMGFVSTVSANFFRYMKAELSPFYISSKNKGITFSIGADFGGARSRYNEPLLKKPRFITKFMEKKDRKAIPAAMITPSEKEVQAIASSIITPPEEAIQSMDVGPPQTTQSFDNKSIWDFLFFWWRRT